MMMGIGVAITTGAIIRNSGDGCSVGDD